MKIIIYLIFTVSIFAQDSTNFIFMKNKINTDLHLISSPHGEDSILIKTPLSVLSSNRLWENKSVQNINDELSASSIIKFTKSEPSFIDSDLFLIVVGSAVAFGTTAAYFKLQSDAKYEKYIETKNKSYLNKTDQYDLYSGIALSALEINFGYLIYRFLTD